MAAAAAPAVKICGVCSAGDAALAAAAGADYVGVILVPERSRTVTVTAAQSILAEATVARVGVFADAPPAQVVAAAARLRLDVVQLHGAETPDVAALLAAATGARVWKAVPVRTAADVTAAGDAFAGAAQGLLLDGWSDNAPVGARSLQGDAGAGSHGGAGVRFDWDAVAAARRALPGGLTVIVAGGLTAANVGAAIAALQPDVVDVSSGVETELRRKSAKRIHAFIDAARSAAMREG